MMVNDVITAMNGSTIYCSEDDNVNGAPMVTINVINKGMLNRVTVNNVLICFYLHVDDTRQSTDHSLNVTPVNELLRDNGVTVTLECNC